jgi:hypothetical protein
MARRYAMAQALLKHDVPIKHWAEGMGNMAESALGGYQLSKLDAERKSDKAQERADLYTALGIPAPAAVPTAEPPSIFSRIGSLFSGSGAGAPAASPEAPAGPVAAPPVVPKPTPPPVPARMPMPVYDTAQANPMDTPALTPPAPDRVPVEPMGDVVRTNPDGTIAGNITAPTIPAATKVAGGRPDRCLGGAHGDRSATVPDRHSCGEKGPDRYHAGVS